MDPREHELATAGSRRPVGAFYTPAWAVHRLLDLTLEPLLASAAAEGPEGLRRVRVLDPACGTGAFLDVVARRIERALCAVGVDPQEAAVHARTRSVMGVDIDSVALLRCREQLSVPGRTDEPSVLHGDALLMWHPMPPWSPAPEPPRDGPAWADVVGPSGFAPEGFDLVVGNPPFLGQLRRLTARRSRLGVEVRRRLAAVAGPYTDSAALFVLLGLGLLGPGGVLCLVQPQSFLAARDAAPVRAEATRVADLTHLWAPRTRVFDAAVDVCAPVLRRRRDEGVDHDPAQVKIVIDVGPGVAPRCREVRFDADALTWSVLLAAASDHPALDLASNGVLGDVAAVEADFRDRYYAIRGHVVDEEFSDGGPRLMTVGLIDPARSLWGRRPARVHRRAWQHPRVLRSGLDESTARWVDARLVPKVLVATQTRVIEALVDEEGGLLPSVPVLSVLPARTGDLYRIAAVLGAPPVSLWAMRHYGGTALSHDALKLSASALRRVPLPGDERRWSVGAEAIREAHSAEDSRVRDRAVRRSARAMCEAYGLDPDGEVYRWWEARMPRRP
ncbi:MAG: N-6 DNA methylase [Microthrixaceae bacterium]